jgi:hypothetical protein
MFNMPSGLGRITVPALILRFPGLDVVRPSSFRGRGRSLRTSTRAPR